MIDTRDIFWAPWEGPGLEHAAVRLAPEGFYADAWVIGAAEGRPFRLSYALECGSDGAVRRLRVGMTLPHARSVDLVGDGGGAWSVEGGEPLPELEGCLDVDIAATPLTNTLPIRRLRLAPGQSADITVVYVDVPSLAVRPDRQRYTCLALGEGGARYRFESPAFDFVAELPVDADGFVEDYPGLFRRVAWPRQGEERR